MSTPLESSHLAKRPPASKKTSFFVFIPPGRVANLLSGLTSNKAAENHWDTRFDCFCTLFDAGGPQLTTDGW